MMMMMMNAVHLIFPCLGLGVAFCGFSAIVCESKTIVVISAISLELPFPVSIFVSIKFLLVNRSAFCTA